MSNVTRAAATMLLLALLTLTPTGLIPPASGARAQPQAWPTLALVEEVTGLQRPLFVTHAHDGSGRLFIVERGGTVRISQNGTLNADPFLDISAKIAVAEDSEQGLLSIAFPSTYADHGYFFVDYTDLNGDTVVARYRVSGDPDLADPTSEHIILTLSQPDPWHNGGQLQFGPHDGYLYIGFGDGGGIGDIFQNGQNLATLHGTIARIDVGFKPTPPISATAAVYLPLVTTTGGGAPAYTIPATNPFTTTAGARPEIWAWGLRNPWRFSFDRATGDLYLGDVGQAKWEEIDVLPAGQGGANLGWPIMEGDQCYLALTCDRTGLTMPVITYPHTNGCAVTGGGVYRGPDPDLDGLYLFGDYCTGAIWGARQQNGVWTTTQLLTGTGFFIAGFGEDEAGNLYVADYLRGGIYKVTSNTK